MIFDRRFKQTYLQDQYREMHPTKPTEADLKYERFEDWLSECPVEILDYDHVRGYDGDYQDIRFSMEGLWNH